MGTTSDGKESRAAALSDSDKRLLVPVLRAEQRWIVTNDLATDVAERRAAAAELGALMESSSNDALRLRAANLVAMLDALAAYDVPALRGLTTKDAAFLIPMANAIRNKQPPSERALFVWMGAACPGVPSAAWLHAQPELRELAAARAEAFVPTAAQGRLAVEYKPLALKGGVVSVKFPGLPNPQLRLPRVLREALDEAEGALSVYARAIESFDAGAAYAQIARLPPELLDRRLHETAVAAVLERLDSLLASSPRTLSDLCRRIFGDRPISTVMLTLLSELLERRNLGFEPDPRHLATIPGVDARVAVFEWHDKRLRPKPDFVAAVAMMQISAAMALSDGHLDATERAVLRRELANSPGLTGSERNRLATRLELMFEDPPDLSKVLSRLKSLRGPARDAIASLLIEVAAADGSVTEAEYSALLSAFRSMGLSKVDLRRRLDVLSEVAIHRSDQPAAPSKDRRSAAGQQQDQQRYEALTGLLFGAT